MYYIDNNSPLEIQDLSSIDYQNDGIFLCDDYFEGYKILSLNENANYETQPNYNDTFISKNFLPSKINSEKNENIIAQNSENKTNQKTSKIFFSPIEPHKKVKPKSLLGRKKANSFEIGKHNKFYQDNMIRKFKSHFKDSLKNLINSNIKKYLEFSKIIINNRRFEIIEIKNINQEQVKDISVEMNRKLLQTTIKNFLSVDICNFYTNYPKNFNKLLIEKLYEIENGEKVTCILEKTFLESLKYFRNDEDILNDPAYSCLKGLEKSFLDFKKKLLEQEGEQYTNQMIYLIKNFENIYAQKRSRAKRKKNI